MRVCASYGSAPFHETDAPMKELRLDVFDVLPDSLDEGTIITLCGRNASAVPKGFRGLVDVGSDGDAEGFRTIRSFHDFQSTPDAETIVSMLSEGDQEISKGAFSARSFTDLHSIFRASQMLKREHVILGMNEIGTVTRIRQSLLGNSFTFGYVGNKTAPGQLSAEKMQALGDDCEIVGILGHPLSHSLSPALQDAAMKSAGINGIYLRFDSENLNDLENVLLEYRIRGINVTAPYKTAVMNHLDEISGAAETVGAVNTVINDGGRLVGMNTDVLGIEYAFRRSGREIGTFSNVLVLGSGGAARAASYTAMKAGCRASVLGRNEDTAASICKDIGTEMAEGRSLEGYDLIINCTSVGMSGPGEYPVDLGGLKGEQTVMDMVYNRTTELVSAAASKGCPVVKGIDMLIGQGAESFRMWFGKEADVSAMGRAIL